MALRVWVLHVAKAWRGRRGRALHLRKVDALQCTEIELPVWARLLRSWCRHSLGPRNEPAAMQLNAEQWLYASICKLP